jgi:2'-hydroxyisoflavone reductase
MKVLVIGGTKFVGRHLVATLMDRGHDVTLFNRGNTNPDLFPKAERIQGDRDGEIAALKGRSWDVAIDTCGYFPRVVRASAELLADEVGRYVFISSVSAYKDFREPGRREDDPLAELEDETVEEITEKTYGGLKALCEKAVSDALGDRALIVRPGLIVGPHDHTDRFSYWPHRMARGGEVLAPGDGDTQVQVIDGRDLAAWTVRGAERGMAGVFNAVGPPFSFASLLAVCEEISDEEASVTWVDEDFLLDQKVEPWSDMPLWIPKSDPDGAGFAAVDGGRAMETGLSFRPLPETIGDTLEWMKERAATELAAGLTPAREAELLKAWHAQN